MKRFTFKKGIHPRDYKYYTSSKSIETLPLPDDVFIPLHQHIGAPCNALVKKGDEVKTGQIIGNSDAFVSSPIHSSVTGKVKAIGNFQHPAGGKVQMVHIHRTGDDDWETMSPITEWSSLSAKELTDRIHQAGIVGLGGAAFPTHVKLVPPKEKSIDSFILNGCECEPYITADHRVMLEMPDKILTGMSIIMKALGVKKGYVGIEDNKPDAIKVMRREVENSGFNFDVISLQTKYPQGAEKMLIDSILKRKVPTGGLPMDVGVIVNNIGTALAVAEAVLEGKPLIRRVVSVTGDAVNEPKNIMARIGVPFRNVVDFCGGFKNGVAQVFMGGPMMGIAQYDLSVPIVKATSGIICTTHAKRQKSMPCIQCGTCIRTCPMFLLPTRIARLSEVEQWKSADELGIANCIECGSCSFVCPSKIPLVQWIRVGKLRVGEMKRNNVI